MKNIQTILLQWMRPIHVELPPKHGRVVSENVSVTKQDDSTNLNNCSNVDGRKLMLKRYMDMVPGDCSNP